MKLKTNLAFVILSLSSALALSTDAGAQTAQTYTLFNSNYNLEAGASHSFALDQNRYVKNITIQAISAHGGSFEVLANGNLKGNIYVPAFDPSYLVTIEEKIGSLELRNISSQSVTIQKVDVTANRAPASYDDFSMEYNNGDEITISDLENLKSFILGLKEHTTGTKWDNYFKHAYTKLCTGIATYGANYITSTASISTLNEVLKALDNPIAKEQIEEGLIVPDRAAECQSVMNIQEFIRSRIR